MTGHFASNESLLSSRAFRRFLAFSVAAHLFVYAVLIFKGFGHARVISASPVMVQMVDMPKSAARPAAPKAAKPPAAKPLPKPPEAKPLPPPKPVVKEIVIPKEAKPLPDKPKPEVAKPDTPAPTADELVAKLAEKYPDQPAPAQEEAAAPVAPAGAAGEFDPLFSPWVLKVQAKVQSNWSGSEVCRRSPVFTVDIDTAGQLSHIALTQSSGDRFCDDTAERALGKSNPLPPPPRADTYELGLIPPNMERQ